MKKLMSFLMTFVLLMAVSGTVLAGSTQGRSDPAPGETNSPPGETSAPPGDGHGPGVMATFIAYIVGLE